MNRIKIFWLWLKRYIRLTLKECSICGRRGVQSTSLRYPDALCSACDSMYNEALSQFGTTDKVESYLKEYGKKNFFMEFGKYSYNPMATISDCTRLAPHICTVNGPCNGWPVIAEDEADEIPCFDTFPAPPTFQATKGDVF